MFFKLSYFYFSYFASIGVYIIFLPQVLINIGYSEFQVGSILAIMPLMKFLTPFLFLKKIKLTNNIFKLSLSVFIISTLFLYSTIDNFYLFFINTLFLGASQSLILPYIETFAIESLKSSYGKARLFGSIGFIVVSLVIAKLFTNNMVVLDFYLVTNISTIIISFWILFDTALSKKDEVIESKKFSIFDNITFWIAIFLMQVSFGGFYNFFTIYETSYGLSIDTISYLWSFGVVCEILMLYYQAPLLKFNLLKIIKITILLTSFRWLLLYLFPSSILVTTFSQSLHALAFALYHTAVITYLFQIYSSNKLAQQFMFGISYGLGGFFGAILAGYIYGENLFLYMSIIAFIGFLILKPFNRVKN